jgi:hypothetical protein
MQVQNTLMWRGCDSRRAGIRNGLPGFSQIEDSIQQHIIAHHLPQFSGKLSLYNSHVLRQFTAADGGSGLRRHIDEADGGGVGAGAFSLRVCSSKAD